MVLIQYVQLAAIIAFSVAVEHQTWINYCVHSSRFIYY